ncbi:hypothetical protein ACHAXA_003790 [Cyclostephanos tholiformis]|uniref:Uncharacterized protein n=1 Tax=Cyclostephanos tholiformis TaxID=382380 RepID=A0ABD3RAD3_9STRA
MISSRGSLALEYPDVVEYIDRIEAEERVRSLPHLLARAPNVEIGDVVAAAAVAVDDDDEDHDGGSATMASLRREGLREFSPSLLLLAPSSYPSPRAASSLASLTTLDVSNNELRDLSGLSSLPNLLRLSIQRNWFDALPPEIDALSKLTHLDASRNFLRPNRDSLRYDGLSRLGGLRVLDLSYNRKIRRGDHREAIRIGISPSTAEILITVWEEMMAEARDRSAVSLGEEVGDGEGTGPTSSSYVGTSAAVRDHLLLRSQLEPLSTFILRRRLVMDFGESPTDPAHVDRAAVMRKLLERYRDEKLSYYDGEDGGSNGDKKDPNAALGKRRVLRIDGEPVRDDLLRELLAELREWRGDVGRGGGSGSNRERPSICAECYMILRAPSGTDGVPTDVLPSRRARRRTKKMDRNRRLWSLALRTLAETDPSFATRCSEIAVTFGFVGSPHIDRQNSSPFYGLSIGEFDEGTGCVAVECSARVIAEVNTKNRLGRVDGRYPHWVTHYVPGQERFSLIYYDTTSPFESPGPAIFHIP